MPIAYQLRIELRDFKPAIYRGVLVDPATTVPKLQDVTAAPTDKLLYLYGFGDDWEHVITLQAAVETERPLPHLLMAQQGCPPEDCGGSPGAGYWASVWHGKTYPEREIALQMFGENEPGWLDFEALQKAAATLQPKLRWIK